MKVLVNKENGIRKNDVMSLLAFMESPHYHKVFAITDVGLLTYPTQEQKKAAIENAVEAFHSLGVMEPKVAGQRLSRAMKVRLQGMQTFW